jgi:malonyl CoA-acyl carrier protein transacylase
VTAHDLGVVIVICARERELNGVESRVLAVLRSHTGRRAAIRAKAMAAMLGITEREVRDVVKTLIEEHHVPIASSVEAPYGFFMPATPEEVEAYANSLKSRIRSIATRLHAFEASTADKIIKQLDLFGGRHELRG